MIKLLLLSALFASTCEVGPFPKPAPQPDPPSPWDSSDAAPPAPEEVDGAAPSACSRACAKLAALGCPEAKPTTGGASCIQVCANAESSGVVSLDPDCVSRAASCKAAVACGR